VEIRVVIDKELRNIGPSIEKLFDELKRRFEKAFNNEMEVEIKEVEKIEKPANLDTPPPVVTSVIRDY